MTYSIGQLARKFNLSRSALLYYHSIGLLSPKQGGGGEYRVYTEEECRRLEHIVLYRQAGLSLQQMKEILDSPKSRAVVSLEQKLDEINQEIRQLRNQQYFIIKLLQNNELLERVSTLPKELLVGLLKDAGVDEEAQWKFHSQFETQYPEKHEAFLELLGMTPEQIDHIRERSRS